MKRTTHCRACSEEVRGRKTDSGVARGRWPEAEADAGLVTGERRR
jgi:hypothetical protein